MSTFSWFKLKIYGLYFLSDCLDFCARKIFYFPVSSLEIGIRTNEFRLDRTRTSTQTTQPSHLSISSIIHLSYLLVLLVIYNNNTYKNCCNNLYVTCRGKILDVGAHVHDSSSPPKVNFINIFKSNNASVARFNTNAIVL